MNDQNIFEMGGIIFRSRVDIRFKFKRGEKYSIQIFPNQQHTIYATSNNINTYHEYNASKTHHTYNLIYSTPYKYFFDCKCLLTSIKTKISRNKSLTQQFRHYIQLFLKNSNIKTNLHYF